MKEKTIFRIRCYSVTMLAVLLTCLASCKFDLHRLFFRDPPTDSRSASLEVVAAPSIGSTSGQVRFAVITDLHFGSDKFRAERQLVASLKGRQAELDFVVLLGDVVETGEDRYFADCEEFVAGLKSALGSDLLVYVVLGNHDLYKDGFGRWQNLDFNAAGGASLFRFVTETAAGSRTYRRSWYFVDTASGIVGTRQMATLTDAMQADGNPKLVFTHIPIYIEGKLFPVLKLSDPRERARLITLFDKSRVDMVLSGHWHPGGFFDYGRFSELCCASFVESSDGSSSWYLMSLDEAAGSLEVEHFRVKDGRLSSSTRTYVLEGSR